MAQMLSAGLFVEEMASSQNVVQSVSASNLGVVGYFSQGPTDTATLVTSSTQFQRVFGSDPGISPTWKNTAAFFANGGTRAYVVRVAPSDASAASASIQSKHYDQFLVRSSTGTTATLTGVAGSFLTNSGSTTAVRGATTFEWRSAGVALTGGTAVTAVNRNGAALVFDGVAGTGTLIHEGRIPSGSLPALKAGLRAVDGGASITFDWLVGAGPATDATAAYTSLTTVGNLITSNVTTDGSFVIDLETGVFVLTCGAVKSPKLGSALKISFTPTVAHTATTGVTFDIAPNGNNNLVTAVTDVIDAGFVNLVDGSFSVTMPAAAYVHKYGSVLATYKTNAWAVTPTSKGSWGDDLQFSTYGNANYFVASTQSYSKFDVQVSKLNASASTVSSPVYDVVESYEELDFSDSTNASYVSSVLNELSDYVRLSTFVGGAPGSLAGVQKTLILGMGSVPGTGNAFSVTVPGISSSNKIGARSVTISYTADADSLVKTITDDGRSALQGSVTGATKTINYSSGALEFTVAQNIKAGTNVTITYAVMPEETVHAELFADTTKAYSFSTYSFYAAGADGTYDSAHFSTAQLTTLSLSMTSPKTGMYALDQVDEIMTVIVPDLAGDATAARDQLTYAQTRALSPSGGDRFIVLCTPQSRDAAGAVDWFRHDLNTYSKYAALYWPWIKVTDPLINNRKKTIPPLGHIAGIYARTDSTKNVGKAPGGTVDGALSYISELEYSPTLGDRDTVYPNKINPLISSPQTGMAVWGVRTIAIESEWRYINTRRLFMFLEKSIFNAMHWVVFENNGAGLWSLIKGQLSSYLGNLFSQGYFAGNSASQAFYVICDETNNTQASIDQGVLIVDIGVAANKPAEMIRLRFAQKSL